MSFLSPALAPAYGTGTDPGAFDAPPPLPRAPLSDSCSSLRPRTAGPSPRSFPGSPDAASLGLCHPSSRRMPSSCSWLALDPWQNVARCCPQSGAQAGLVCLVPVG